MKIQPTQHAIDRFLERIQDGVSRDNVSHRLSRMAATARYQGPKRDGASLYVSEHVGLVVKENQILTVYQYLPEDISFQALFAA